MLDALTLAIVLTIGFSAGFLDSIVGGGGLIATPALQNLFPSFEILKVIATNRTSSIVGTSAAAWNYLQNVKLPTRMLLICAVSACACSYIGINLAVLIPPKVLNIIVLSVIVFVAIYSFFKKDLGQSESIHFTPERLPYATASVAAVCGFYNGLIGPGTGTLLVFAFVSIIGFDFLKASAISKVVNVAGDISSWIILFSKGMVFWPAAIPLVISNVIGSYMGSRMAILRGSKFIRVVLLVVVVLLVSKKLWDIFGGKS